MYRPTDDNGRVVSHASESLVATARRCARVLGLGLLLRDAHMPLILDLSLSTNENHLLIVVGHHSLVAN